MSSSQMNRIEPGQTWRRGGVEREVIAIEREMGREPVIVFGQTLWGNWRVPYEVCRLPESRFAKWAAGAAIVRGAEE